MFVKICANTNVEDAILAAELGADAVGFVFASSPRMVTPEVVATITPILPQKLEKIGVFHELDFNNICRTVRTAHLTGVQLHGGFSPPLVSELRREFGKELRIIQTNHWRVGGATSDAFAATLRELSVTAEVDDALIDSRTAVADGGTGITFDWIAAREVLSALGQKPLIVAGGLNATNVKQAIDVLQPFGVDVASGVEASYGVKDPQKLKAFIAAARS